MLFGISSLCIGLAQNSIQIITFRAIQGIGSAIIAPTTLALLMGHFEGKKEVKPLVTTAPLLVLVQSLVYSSVVG